MSRQYRDLEPQGRANGYTVSTGWRLSDEGDGESIAVVLEGEGEPFEAVAFKDLENAAQVASIAARSIVYALAAIGAHEGGGK
jgi:hypothetical protein